MFLTIYFFPFFLSSFTYLFVYLRIYFFEQEWGRITRQKEKENARTLSKNANGNPTQKNMYLFLGLLEFPGFQLKTFFFMPKVLTDTFNRVI